MEEMDRFLLREGIAEVAGLDNPAQPWEHVLHESQRMSLLSPCTPHKWHP